MLPRRINPIPPWDNFEFKIDMHIYNETDSKKDTTNIIYKNLFYELINKYENFAHIYTDGSVKEDQRGCAVVYNEHEELYKLPKAFSIFSCESYALEKAIELSIRIKLNKTLILTDSKSVLEAVNNYNNSDTRILSWRRPGLNTRPSDAKRLQKVYR